MGAPLAAVARVTPEEFARDLGASFGSLQGTLVQIYWGESRWLRFWREGVSTPELTAAEYPDLQTLTTRWIGLEGRVTRNV